MHNNMAQHKPSILATAFKAVTFLPKEFLAIRHMVWRPTRNKHWEVGQRILPCISIDNGTITITNMRDFGWTAPYQANERYYTATYALADITGIELVISHFSKFHFIAHPFLNFIFKDGERVSVSLESRRGVGEEFSPWRGMLRNYELIYVVGTARDVVGIRTGHRKEEVYLYRTVTDANTAQKIFAALIPDINRLHDIPTYYNTLARNCVNEITRIIKKVTGMRFPFIFTSIFPGYFDWILYKRKLIEGAGKDFEEVQRAARIDHAYVEQEFGTRHA